MSKEPADLERDDLDSMPLSKRMLRPKKPSPSPSPSPLSSVVCALPAHPVGVADKRISLDNLREWPGLPRGVKFDPSDEDILWHLLRKVGNGEDVSHPLISEFIISLDNDVNFGYIHPQRLPGVKQDGSVSFFFHRRFMPFNSKQQCQKIQNADSEVVCWHKIGKAKPVFVDGVCRGCKQIMVLSVKITEKFEETNWVMHQYYVGKGEDVEGDFVASKIFYNLNFRKSDMNAQDLNMKIAVAGVVEAVAVDSISSGPKLFSENQHEDLLYVEASAQGGSRKLPKLVRYKKEDAIERVPDHRHPAGIQLLLEEPTDSPNSTVTVSSDAAKQFPSPENDVKYHVREDHDLEPQCPPSPDFLEKAGTLEEGKEVKTEPLEGSYMVGVVESATELPQCVDSIPLTFPVEVKTEGELQDISVSRYQEESAVGCQAKESLIGSNLSGDIFDAASYPVGYHFDALSKLQNANCSVKVKIEPLESEQLMSEDSPYKFPESYISRAEVKGEFVDGHSTDELDDIPLKQRIEMAFLDSDSGADYGDNRKCSKKTVGRTSRHVSQNLNSKARIPSLRRKRKRTATDSVETALEEDSPGLLQILLDKGITVEEMKLYKEDGDVEPMETSGDDSFQELKSVMSKLFLERSTLFKFSTARQINSSKALYCLSCLISLIEQTRYLRFRSIPVEWGWCRDLQSFIFIFEKHNRIVIERPEYGYATYFFELVDSLPADWQAKRLVTAMKLPYCSRTTLIENRPLVVGVDLSEGEARVLEDYGWTLNTGLGSMLNYCDRVVHDRSNETYNLDWRAKIGKLLMYGQDSGRAPLLNFPKKAPGYACYQSPDIKSEFSFEFSPRTEE